MKIINIKSKRCNFMLKYNFERQTLVQQQSSHDIISVTKEL